MSLQDSGGGGGSGGSATLNQNPLITGKYCWVHLMMYIVMIHFLY